MQLQKLPVGSFEWIEPDSFDTTLITDFDEVSNVGYTIEVDLDYPENLHNAHRDFPLCPEKTRIVYDNLSPFTKQLFVDTYPGQNPASYTGVKLTPTLCNKSKVVLHIRTLKLYLELGMKLKKVHKVIKFRQSNFLATYITKCTENRRKAKFEWERNMWKLFANSCYGKMIENARNFVDIKIVNTQEKMLRHLNNPLFNHVKILTDSVQVIMLKQASIKIAKPIFIGMSILEFAKLFMYHFWYNILKPAFQNDKLTLHLHDTDSFIFSILKGRFNRALFSADSSLRDIIDFSNLPVTNQFDSFRSKVQNTLHHTSLTDRKNVPGFVKDELNWDKMILFAGLRAKVYSFTYLKHVDGKQADKSACKGVNRGCVKQFLNTTQYVTVLFSQKTHSLSFHSLRKTKQSIALIKQRKKALCAFDDKLYA